MIRHETVRHNQGQRHPTLSNYQHNILNCLIIFTIFLNRIFNIFLSNMYYMLVACGYSPVLQKREVNSSKPRDGHQSRTSRQESATDQPPIGSAETPLADGRFPWYSRNTAVHEGHEVPLACQTDLDRHNGRLHHEINGSGGRAQRALGYIYVCDCVGE